MSTDLMKTPTPNLHLNGNFHYHTREFWAQILILLYCVVTFTYFVFIHVEKIIFCSCCVERFDNCLKFLKLKPNTKTKKIYTKRFHNKLEHKIYLQELPPIEIVIC